MKRKSLAYCRKLTLSSFVDDFISDSVSLNHLNFTFWVFFSYIIKGRAMSSVSLGMTNYPSKSGDQGHVTLFITA